MLSTVKNSKISESLLYKIFNTIAQYEPISETDLIITLQRDRYYIKSNLNHLIQAGIVIKTDGKLQLIQQTTPPCAYFMDLVKGIIVHYPGLLELESISDLTELNKFLAKYKEIKNIESKPEVEKLKYELRKLQNTPGYQRLRKFIFMFEDLNYAVNYPLVEHITQLTTESVD